MLRKRAAAELARQVYPDIILGLYSEAEEEEIARDVTPTSAQQIVARPLVAAADPVDGEIVVEQKPPAATTEEPLEVARVRWRQTLETCATTAEADKALREVAKRLPDKDSPERIEINGWYKTAMTRLKPGARTRQSSQSIASPPATAQQQQEIPIDKPSERVPGEDDDQ
jgi:hypothetical protein